MSTRKFDVGDVAYGWTGSLRHANAWENDVVSISGRSYTLRSRAGGRPKRITFVEADAKLWTKAEWEERRWRGEHRRKLQVILESADVPTLRRVAEVLGYDPGEGM